MTKISELRTQRVLLRGLSASDAQTIADLISDWDVIRMLARPPHPYRIDDARGYLDRAIDYPWEYAIAWHAAPDRLIGVVGITGHLGYWLAKPAWGQGVMTEAAAALIDAYFGSTQAKSIKSGAFADNPSSQRVLRKLGFLHTGTRRQFVPSRQAEVDHLDMALSRSDWQARHHAGLDATGAGGD